MIAHPFLTLGLSFGMMTALWPLRVRLRDVSIVDILWAPAFAVLAWSYVFVPPHLGARGWIALMLVTVWALRLGSHIWARWRRLGHEDYRYAEIRRRNGPAFPFTSLVWIFWLQGLLLWVISGPLQAALSGRGPLNALDLIATAMIAAGILLEAVADTQLTRFRADPDNRGCVLDTGVWAWSRHPNYFGDFLIWWGSIFVPLPPRARKD